jgi:hypothetical protein
VGWMAAQSLSAIRRLVLVTARKDTELSVHTGVQPLTADQGIHVVPACNPSGELTFLL